MPRLLDLFCGAGGCSVGYARAGFDVVGVDHVDQPNYPFEFVRADVMALTPFDVQGYDAVHASPPCQAHSSLRSLHAARDYPDLIEPTRQLLRASGRPWVMENVIGAPLDQAFTLCGSSFGLNVRRHRLFETGGGFMIAMVPPCAHHWQTPRFRSLDQRQLTLAGVVGVHGHTNYAGELELRKDAMGIGWMSPHELTQAIPPAYCEFIGDWLMFDLTQRSAA